MPSQVRLFIAHAEEDSPLARSMVPFNFIILNLLGGILALPRLQTEEMFRYLNGANLRFPLQGWKNR